MKEYSVEGKVTLHVYVDVTASSPEEAIKQAVLYLEDFYRLTAGLYHDNNDVKIDVDAYEYED